jgi:(2Fe-2S) ferredoxin
MIAPKHHVLICAGSKLVGDKLGTCHSRNATGLVQHLIMELEDHDLASEVIVSTTSCYGMCDKGPIMVVYPDGIWYGKLDADAIETIVEDHLEAGTPVAEYQI